MHLFLMICLVTLKKIAETYSTVSSNVSLSALHGLWLLGEPQVYFLQNAQQHSSNRLLAYHIVVGDGTRTRLDD